MPLDQRLAIAGAATALAAITAVGLVVGRSDAPPVTPGCVLATAGRSTTTATVLHGPTQPNELVTVTVRVPLGARPMCLFTPEQDEDYEIVEFATADHTDFTSIAMTARNKARVPRRLSGLIHYLEQQPVKK